MYFLKLIRPLNLTIIAFTMVASYWHLKGLTSFSNYSFDHYNLFILIASTVIIAAAGNIINDYFDVRADRINKPEKLIITKHIKRRWAIISHWSFNGIGFMAGIYLSVVYQTITFLFIHLISINLLWFYSMYFKRKALLGNFIIALLTGLIPILTLLFVCFSISSADNTSVLNLLSDHNLKLLYAVSTMALLSNFSREIIKDIQDMKGDQLIYVRSLPMVIGEFKAKIISGLILLLVILICGHFSYLMNWSLSKIWPLLIAQATALIAIILLFMNQLKMSDLIIKISMLFGVITLIV
jgi:4-hydroxybenzoate polyprenyltransferase